MAGKGKRFNDVYFHGPKPLIEIDGKPMIEHITNMFSNEDEFIFICHEDHLQKTEMRRTLNNLVPNCQIVSVTDQQIEGGPVYSCKNVFNLIDDGEELIVNYCDFTMQWDYQDFLQTVKAKENDGAIPSFKDFHPASLGDTYYAYMKFNEQDYLTELREKEPFSENRIRDYASTGTYYFKRGSDFKKYSQQVMDQGMNAKWEAYVTLPYILMIQDGLKILNYEVEKFICWGTPRDYEIYKFWSEFFFRRSGQVVGFNNVNIKTTNIFPIAGDKRDFTNIGITEPNFLIPLMNQPLITSTVKSYPKGLKNIFIALSKHREKHELDRRLKKIFKDSQTIYLDEKTAGNGATILKSEGLVDPNSSVCVSGCSYILDYDERKLAHFMEKGDFDVILLSFTHHECVLRNPEPHSYFRIKNGMVEQISEKEMISDTPYQNPAFTGTAIYRRAADLFSSIKKHLTKPDTNHSFLTAVNELIKENKKVVVFEVDKFVSLLTPDDYQEFVYWQDYFDSLNYHPYSKMVH
tara:strand:- start:480 stop:2039 length:1560 start_codon:yes stop_codon:yes gene_type:complete